MKKMLETEKLARRINRTQAAMAWFLLAMAVSIFAGMFWLATLPH
jgi:hypothetical protein